MGFPVFSSQKGLTLIELLIFAAIFSGAAVIFVSILVSVTRVELRQTGAAEVQQQSQFILQTVQNVIASASYVSSTEPIGVASSGIYVWTANPTKNLTRIYLQNEKIFLAEGASAPVPLTSPDVRVTDVKFTKFSNPPGHDSVNFSFTMELASDNPQKKFSQTLATGIARVGAATFDDNLVPGGSYALGNSSNPWTSINSTLYFSGGNVGIGTAAPLQKFEVNGGVRLNGNQPNDAACDSTNGPASGRGTLRFFQGGSNASDTLQVCLKDKGGYYRWRTISDN